MSENSEQNPTNPGSKNPIQRKRSGLVILLAVLVSVEACAVFAGAIFFLSRIFMETTESLAGAFVIFTITTLIAVGLIITAIATFSAKSWTRGSIATWQILQFAVATSFIQGNDVWKPTGWFFATVSILTLAILFSKKMLLIMTSET